MNADMPVPCLEHGTELVRLSVETAERTAQQYRLLAMEADHRLLNNLQTIASYLSLQRRHCSSPELASHLVSAAQRVVALQKVHRALRSAPHHTQVELKKFLSELGADYVEAFGQEKGADFQVSVTGDEEVMTASQATALATVANELLLNAIKHGTGAVAITLSPRPGALCLSVTNDGPPLRADFDAARSRGLGMGIVTGLIKNMGGTLEIGFGDQSHGPTFAAIIPIS